MSIQRPPPSKPMSISKVHFYKLGGFSNPKLFRKANTNGNWVYYQILD